MDDTDLRVGLLCDKWTTVTKQGYKILIPPLSAENCEVSCLSFCGSMYLSQMYWQVVQNAVY